MKTIFAFLTLISVTCGVCGYMDGKIIAQALADHPTTYAQTNIYP